MLFKISIRIQWVITPILCWLTILLVHVTNHSCCATPKLCLLERHASSHLSFVPLAYFTALMIAVWIIVCPSSVITEPTSWSTVSSAIIMCNLININVVYGSIWILHQLTASTPLHFIWSLLFIFRSLVFLFLCHWVRSFRYFPLSVPLSLFFFLKFSMIVRFSTFFM